MTQWLKCKLTLSDIKSSIDWIPNDSNTLLLLLSFLCFLDDSFPFLPLAGLGDRAFLNGDVWRLFLLVFAVASEYEAGSGVMRTTGPRVSASINLTERSINSKLNTLRQINSMFTLCHTLAKHSKKTTSFQLTFDLSGSVSNFANGWVSWPKILVA